MRRSWGDAGLRSFGCLAVIAISLQRAPREARAEGPEDDLVEPGTRGCQVPPELGRDTAPGTLLDLALRCYDVERYDTALSVLEHLEARAPNPTVVFNLGAVHAAVGHCKEATHYYRSYLDQTQSESGREEARQQLELLGDCADPPSRAVSAPELVSPLASAPRSTEPTAPLPIATGPSLPSVASPATDISRRSPLARSPEGDDPSVSRVAAWVLFGGGAAFLLASGGLAYAAEREETRSSPSQRGDDIAAAERQGLHYNALSWACAGGALALASSALLLLAFEPGEGTEVSLTTGQRGAMRLSVEHRF